MREWEFIVHVILDDDEPPGDHCGKIRDALTDNDINVMDVGWVSVPIAEITDPDHG